MEQIDGQAGKSLIVILPGPRSALVTAKSLSEGRGRSHCCLLIRRGNTVCFVWFYGISLLSHIKTRPWSTVWATQVGSKFASPISIWQRKCSRAFRICRYTVSISPTKTDKPCDEWEHAYIQSSGSLPQNKIFFQGSLHMTIVFTWILISLKQDYDRPFYWSVIRNVCTVWNNFLACVAFIFEIQLSFVQMSTAVMEPVYQPRSSERWEDYSLQCQLNNV